MLLLFIFLYLFSVFLLFELFACFLQWRTWSRIGGWMANVTSSVIFVDLKRIWKHSPCDRRSADSLRFVCDPQEEDERFMLGINKPINRQLFFLPPSTNNQSQDFIQTCTTDLHCYIDLQQSTKIPTDNKRKRWQWWIYRVRIMY